MKHLNLRLPDDLHAAVTAVAKRERRSVNSMILVLLEKALRDHSTPTPKEHPR